MDPKLACCCEVKLPSCRYIVCNRVLCYGSLIEFPEQQPSNSETKTAKLWTCKQGEDGKVAQGLGFGGGPWG